MKRLIVLSLLFAFPVMADFLDEQELATSDKSCKIHYLTTKPKKMWTVEVDKSYCKDGFVHGFATVTLKDALDRVTESLHGFFHAGYWLSDFTGRIDKFYRSSPDDGVQDFIYKTGEDSDLNLTYYMVARATSADKEHYSSFAVCSEKPILLIAHEPIDDFKQSLFQSAALKQAQLHLSKLCPQTTKMQILGISNQTPNADRIVLSADIDSTNDSITIAYHTPIDKTSIPKPTELRHEESENLLTIQPQKIIQEKPPVTKESTLLPPSQSSKDIQSVVDLALQARVVGGEITGKGIVYVDHTDENQTAIVTKPTSLIIRSQTALSPGWHMIQGVFSTDGHQNFVQLLSAKSCRKEWCADEN